MVLLLFCVSCVCDVYISVCGYASDSSFLSRPDHRLCPFSAENCRKDRLVSVTQPNSDHFREVCLHEPEVTHARGFPVVCVSRWDTVRERLKGREGLGGVSETVWGGILQQTLLVYMVLTAVSVEQPSESDKDRRCMKK